MSVATDTVTEYHPLAQKFSDILDSLEFQHETTITVTENGVRDEVEIWGRTKSDDSGFSEVSIGWVTGRVLVKKYVRISSKKNTDGNHRDRLAHQEEFKLTSFAGMETIARAAM